GEPGRLIRKRAAGREQTHPAAAARQPVIKSFHRFGRQHVDRIDPGEAGGNSRDGIRYIAVVVTVSSRGVYDGGVIDAGGIHLLQQHFVGGRPLARPGGLRTAKWGQRIARGVRRDDVRMDVDDGHALTITPLTAKPITAKPITIKPMTTKPMTTKPMTTMP